MVIIVVIIIMIILIVIIVVIISIIPTITIVIVGAFGFGMFRFILGSSSWDPGLLATKASFHIGPEGSGFRPPTAWSLDFI